MSISGIGASSPYIPQTAPQTGSVGQGAGVGGSSSASTPDPTTDPVGWLMDYTQMTPAEQMQATILRELGMTKAQYDALSPAEKAKVDEKIKDLIKQQVEQQTEKKTGMIVDVTA